MSEHTISIYTSSDDEQLPHGITMDEISRQVVRARERVIEPKMGYSLASRFADDVVSRLFEEVWQTVRNGKFDPSKAPLGFWVLRIADLRTRDKLRKINNPRRWEGEQLMREHPEKSIDQQLEEAAHSSIRGREVDHAALYAELEAERAWLYPLMSTCVQVMDQRKFYRAYLVFFKFDGDINLASEHLHLDPGKLRACTRMFRVHLQVIHHALSAYQDGATGTVSDLIWCLPNHDEAGGHRRAIAEAISVWVGRGRKVSDVETEFVGWFTGYRFHTVRQRLPEVLTLMNLAFTVITASPTDPATQEQQP